jgi:hypothetical protein
VTLRQLAHARAGDKGNVVNISVIAYDARDYPCLAREVTAERVSVLFADIVLGDVIRYELPQLGALNFVLRCAARDTVTQSVALDAHGKSLSSALLDLEVRILRC